MRLSTLALFVFGPLAQALLGQPTMEPPPRQVAAMKKLDFLLGEWRGESWIQMGPAKRASTGTETVQSKLNGMVLLIEGVHQNKDDAKTVHNALGVISYNPKTSAYRFHAYTANGQMVETTATVKDDSLEWEFEPAPGTKIRYLIRVEKGQWLEKGEMSRDGTNWRQFFEMNLQKTK